ncbi:MAG TPA: hypothetical protein VFO16_24285 [Pseudonocardiaceae bacterium]|nr:hypothetical protein [Pseudonocardiaceae bacterium]
MLPADLVVDATGRGSRTPVWLEQLGYPRPAREHVQVRVRYASRIFRLRDGALGDDLLIIAARTASNPRSGALTSIEGGQHLVSLGGILGDTPPLDIPGFFAYAQSLGFSDIYEAIADAQPVDDGASFHYPANIRTRYDRLRRFPDGLLVLGDAVCALNPLYGQGMAVAALQATTLRQILDAGCPPAAHRYFRRIARVIDAPWNIAVGGDLANSAVAGKRTIPIRLLNAYLPQLHAAAATDPALGRAFARVTGLIDPPSSLLLPHRLTRVLTTHLYKRPRQATTRTSNDTTPVIRGVEKVAVTKCHRQHRRSSAQ